MNLFVELLLLAANAVSLSLMVFCLVLPMPIKKRGKCWLKKTNCKASSKCLQVYLAYAGVSTAVVIFAKGGTTDKVWFYDMQSDGFTLDDKRTKTPDNNDIPDIISYEFL